MKQLSFSKARNVFLSNQQKRTFFIFIGSVFILFLGEKFDFVVAQNMEVNHQRIDADAQKLVDTVIAGIKANNSKIQSLLATLEEVSENRLAKKKETVTAKLPNGGSFSYTIFPKNVWKWNFYLDENTMRRDLLTLDEGKEPLEIMLCKEGEWTQYAPDEKIAWRRLGSNMLGVPMADIREPASLDITDTTVNVLQQYEILSAKLISRDQEQTVIEVVTRGRRGEHYWQFDPSQGFLPISRILRYGDGSINQFVKITYQNIPDKDIWFLQEEKTLTFGQNVTFEPSDKNWNNSWTLCVKNLEVNVPVDTNIFEVHFPDGVRVHDNVAENEFTVGKKDNIDSDEILRRGKHSFLLLIATAMLFIVGFGTIIAKRFCFKKG